MASASRNGVLFIELTMVKSFFFPPRKSIPPHGGVLLRTVITFVTARPADAVYLCYTDLPSISLIHLLVAFFIFCFSCPPPFPFLCFSLETPCSAPVETWYSGPEAGAAPS
jgi:hypothetical protein